MKTRFHRAASAGFFFIALFLIVLSIYAENPIVKVTVENAAVRIKPDMGSDIIEYVSKGALYEFDAKSGGWYQIKISSQVGVMITGYIHEMFVEEIDVRKKHVLAVMPLYAVDVSDDEARRVTLHIIDYMKRIGSFSVLEIAQCESVLMDMGLKASTRLDLVNAVRAGNRLSADKAIIGEIGKIGEAYVIQIEKIDLRDVRIETASRIRSRLGFHELSAAMSELLDPLIQSESEPVSIQTEKTDSAVVKPGVIVSLQETDLEPVLLRGRQPAYPESARRMRIEGTVVVNILISETGKVLDVRTVRGVQGYPVFERAAQNAVLQWEFRPAVKDGIPVKVWKAETFTFKMGR